MSTIARRTLIGAILLLLMPLTVWFSGWQWLPGPSGWWLQALYAVTETVTQPWGIITHLLLCTLFLWALRPRLRGAIILAIILSAAVLLGRAQNRWLKGWYKSRDRLLSGWKKHSKFRSSSSTL